MMSFLPMRLVLAALLLAPIASAHAEKADKDKPINFSSDQGGANYESKSGSRARRARTRLADHWRGSAG